MQTLSSREDLEIEATTKAGHAVRSLIIQDPAGARCLKLTSCACVAAKLIVVGQEAQLVGRRRGQCRFPRMVYADGSLAPVGEFCDHLEPKVLTDLHRRALPTSEAEAGMLNASACEAAAVFVDLPLDINGEPRIL